MKKILKYLPVFMLSLFFSSLFFACKKNDGTNSPVVTPIDYTLLTGYKWLVTPLPDTNYFLRVSDSVFYRDEQILADSTVLIYNPDSTYSMHRFTTEIVFRSTIPYTGPFLPNHTPVYSTYFSGPYSVNTNDSTVTTTNIVSGTSLPPVTRKILFLSRDSLQLQKQGEGIITYHAGIR